MKKRILSVFMAICLMLTLLPTAALAVDGNPALVDGEEYTGSGLVYYRIYEYQLLKMMFLAVDESERSSIGADTEINNITLYLEEPLIVSPYGSVTLGTKANLTTEHRGNYYENGVGITNVNNKAVSSNIDRIVVEYNGTKSVEISSEDMCFDLIENGGHGRYEIEANNDAWHVVAFYNQTGTTEVPVYSNLYAVRFVKDGENLANNMPANPSYTSGDYRFANWDLYPTGGNSFLPGNAIYTDTLVYERRAASTWTVSQYHVMNRNNALLNRILEIYNAQVPAEEAAALDDILVDALKIQVNGSEGKHTDPTYGQSGWSSGYEYYDARNGQVANENTHVSVNDVTGITIYVTIKNQNVEITIPANEELGNVSVSLVSEAYAEIMVNAPPTAPDDGELTGDPDDPTDTGLLDEGTVTVDCVGESNHAARTDGLLPGTYSIGEVYWSGTSTEGAYYVDITIVDEDYDTYVKQYDVDTTGDETHTVVSDEDESKTITLKYVGSGWTVPTGAIPVTIDVTCDPGTGGDLADNQIAIEVYLDGQQVEDENTFSNYVSHTSGPASDGTTGSGAWDTDLDAYVYTYGENTQNSAYVDLTVTHIDNNTIVQGIEADLVYGDGDPGITDQEDTFSLNNVTMRSTVKVYLNTVYTVAYSVPAGTAAPTDGGKYITVAALGSNDNDPPVEGGSSVEYRWINGAVGNDASDTYHTQITLEAVPTGLDGWYAEDNTTKYSGSETIDLTTASMDVLDANSDRTITFTAKETGPADITVTKDVTKVGTIEITSATDPIPSALAGDEIVWTITVQNVGGETQTTNVTITENLTGALITDPQNMHVTVNDNVITVKGLEANESVTITVTYTVTAADVEAGTAIKNSVTVDDGDGDPTTEETEDEVPVVEADILDVPKISHQVNTDPWHNSADTATVEHLVTTTNPTISYQAVLDLSAMELQNTSNTNQGFGPYTIYSIMNDDPWGKLTSSYWNLLDHDDTIINLCVKFDSQLDVTETAMQNVTVTSPYFERTGDPVTYDSTTGYWKIPCKAVDSPQTAGTDADDEVILSGITLNLTSAAQSALNTSKVLTLTSGGYIDGTVTFGGTLSALNPLTVYGEATDDVVNLALDAWDDGDNTETGGDGTPDYQQALIKYVSANTSYGTVNPATEVVTLTGMTGNTGTATISGSTASANSGYSFTNWTNTAGLSAVTSATLGAQTFTAQGGSTYTFTANFTSSGGSDPGTGGSESKPYLRFDSNGGTEFDPIDENGRDFSINVYHDEKYGDHIPTRPGYRFTGWYNTNTLRTRIDEDDILRVTSYRTVFAGWEETSVPGMLNGDDHYAYIQGYSDGTVRPNANITRAQVATIFFRLLDEDVRDDNLTTYNTFPDVDEDYWANTAISTMASLGVINGRNSGLFDPDAYITRAEFAAICARFDDSGVDGITTFTDTVGHWAEDEISRAAALGWIQGYSDGTFRPNQYITRAQAVTMINRVLCRLPEDTDDLLSGMNTWTDCHEDDWFYLAIQEATNSHDFVAKDRVYESWTDLNRAPDWSRYE